MGNIAAALRGHGAVADGVPGAHQAMPGPLAGDGALCVPRREAWDPVGEGTRLTDPESPEAALHRLAPDPVPSAKASPASL